VNRKAGREVTLPLRFANPPMRMDFRMHELSIASSILETVRAEKERHPGARVLKVGVRVGELTGVDPNSLTFCFESLVGGTDLAPLALEIEPRPRRHRCPRCAHTFQVVDYEVSCPACGAGETQLISGDELELAYLEVEEP
jgi:hydrogenase nickel incorporation protein HypA/HybF